MPNWWKSPTIAVQGKYSFQVIWLWAEKSYSCVSEWEKILQCGACSPYYNASDSFISHDIIMSFTKTAPPHLTTAPPDLCTQMSNKCYYLSNPVINRVVIRVDALFIKIDWYRLCGYWLLVHKILDKLQQNNILCFNKAVHKNLSSYKIVSSQPY